MPASPYSYLYTNFWMKSLVNAIRKACKYFCFLFCNLNVLNCSYFLALYKSAWPWILAAQKYLSSFWILPNQDCNNFEYLNNSTWMLKIIETSQSFAKYSCQEDFPVFSLHIQFIYSSKSCLISPDPKLLILSTWM